MVVMTYSFLLLVNKIIALFESPAFAVRGFGIPSLEIQTLCRGNHEMADGSLMKLPKILRSIRKSSIDNVLSSVLADEIVCFNT